MSNIPTAHVILGIDDSNNGGEAAFIAFDRARKSTEVKSISSWYKDSSNKQHVLLSTLDESDIVKFNHSFNLTETQDQSLFIFEVMDPYNTFEKNYFNRFYKGTTNYSSFVDGYLKNIKSDVTETLIGDEGDPDVSADDFRDQLDFYIDLKEVQLALGPLGEKSLTSVANDIWAAPYSQSLFVTFGVGDNISTWAPVQRCQLVSLHYSLTSEGVRKYTLKFVSNAGLLAFGEDEATQQYLLSTGRLENRVTLPFIFQPDSGSTTGSKAEWQVNDPVKMVTSMVKQMFSTIMKDPPFIILEDFERVLQARWTQAVINYFKQKTDDLRDNSLLRDSILGNNLFDPDQLALKLARDLVKVDEVPPRVFEDDPTNTPLFGLDSAAAIARRDALKELGLVEGVPRVWSSITVEELDALYTQYNTSLANRGLYDNSITEAGENKARTWFDAYKAGTRYSGSVTFGTNRSGKYEIGRIGIIEPSRPFRSFTNPRPAIPGQFVDLGTGYRLPLYVRNYLKSVLKDVDSFRSSGIDSDTTYDQIKETAFQKIKEEYVNLNTITLSTKEKYTLYLKAGTAFFNSLGMTVGPLNRDALTMMGAPDIYGPIMSLETFNNKNADINEISVSWKKDGVRETSDALRKLIGSMNIEEKDELMILAFSELSLVEKFRGDADSLKAIYADIKAPGSPADPSFEKLNSVILVSSVRIISSLVNSNPIEDLQNKSALYDKLVDLFTGFKREEPIQLPSEDKPGWSFSPLNSNPDVEALQLPSQYPGEANYLSVFSNLESIEELSGKQGPYTEEEFRTILSEARIPVFNYGFKNSNVRSCDFDLNPWYGYFLDVIPTTILTGVISSSLKNEPAVQKVQQFYNDLSGAPVQSIDLAIDKYWEENIEEGRDRTLLSRRFPWLDPPRSGIYEIHKVSGDIASLLAVRALGELSLAGSQNLPDFRKIVKSYLRVALGAPSIASKLVLNPEMQSEALEKILLMRQKLESRTFTGTLSTLPIFSIMSPAKTISSRSLLYFVEPEFTLSPVENNSRYRSTWLSGEYYIVGYEVEISKDDIICKFSVVKNPDNAQGIGG